MAQVHRPSAGVYGLYEAEESVKNKMSDDIIIEYDDTRKSHTTIKEFIEKHKQIVFEVILGNWTTETPTQDGWYWALQNGEDEIEIVQVSNGSVMTIFYDAWKDILSFSYWLGPIPMPTPPRKGK